MVVAEHLHFHVARLGQVFLHQHGGIAKAGTGLALGRGQCRIELISRPHLAHALAAATGGRLQQYRVAHALRFLSQQGRLLVRTVVARHQRHARFAHDVLGGSLGAHRLYGCTRRADEHQPPLHTGAGEASVLGQKPIAGMYGLRLRGKRRSNNVLRLQVAFSRGGRADVYRFIRHAHVQRVAIRVRVDGHRGDAQPTRGADDAAGDFSAIGDQQLVEHG